METNRNLISQYLKDSPHTIDIAENGRIAVEKYINDIYDIVLMDIEMPEMDGLEATRQIRKWEMENNKEKIPVIAITAHAFAEQKKKCFEAGCTGFLSKPLKKTILLQMLTELFEFKNKNSKTAIPNNKLPSNFTDISFENSSSVKRFKALINGDLEELIPDLFEEIEKELGNISSALKSGQFDTLKMLGHGLKGATANYGLNDLSEIFQSMETGAKKKDKGMILYEINRIKNYIANVKIEYMSN